jgi:hypothetical protein
MGGGEGGWGGGEGDGGWGWGGGVGGGLHSRKLDSTSGVELCWGSCINPH